MKLLFPIISIILSIIIFFTFFDPMYKEVKVLKQDVALYNETLDNSTELQKIRDSLLEVYKNIKQEDKDKLENFLPGDVNNIKFILEVERLANMRSMPIKNIKFEADSDKSKDTSGAVSGTVKNNKPYGVFPIEFTTSGSYDSFVSFLKDLEYNLRLSDVESIFFENTDAKTSGGATANSDVFDFTLKVNTYWLK